MADTITTSTVVRWCLGAAGVLIVAFSGALYSHHQQKLDRMCGELADSRVDNTKQWTAINKNTRNVETGRVRLNGLTESVKLQFPELKEAINNLTTTVQDLHIEVVKMKPRTEGR